MAIGAKLSGLAVLAAMIAATPAYADPPTGSRLGDRNAAAANQGKVTDSDIQSAYQFAACLKAKRESTVRQFLDALTIEDLEKEWEQLSKGISCLNVNNERSDSDTTQFSFTTDVIRGMLAEAVLDDQSGLADLPILPIQTTYSRPWFAVSGRNSAVDEMAVCVAEINPGAIVTLIKTLPRSEEEKQQVAALGPVLAPCLRNTAKLTANRLSLRAALAEGLYHRVFDPPVPVPAVTGSSK